MAQMNTGHLSVRRYWKFSKMNILFITHPYPNYVPDLLLHGLRKLLGPNVVDYPRKDCLYKGVLGVGVCPDNQLCLDWFPQDYDQIDRDDITSKIAGSYFQYIVCDIRALTLLQKINPNNLSFYQ